jgi:hypothetical protein
VFPEGSNQSIQSSAEARSTEVQQFRHDGSWRMGLHQPVHDAADLTFDPTAQLPHVGPVARTPIEPDALALEALVQCSDASVVPGKPFSPALAETTAIVGR